MKFDFKTIVIIALLLLIVGGILLWPKKEDSAAVQNARDSISQLLEANVTHSMQVRTLETQLVQTKVKATIDSARFIREITVKNQQLAKKRVQIDTVFKDSPVLQSYLQTADSVFSMMHNRIDSLEASKQFQAALYNDLIYVSGKQITNLEMVVFQKDVVIKDQEKTIRKSRRSGKLAKVLIPVVGVGALFLGSQL